MGEQLNQVGELLTLKEAARQKRGTYWGLYMYVRRNAIPVNKLGKSVLIRLVDIAGYTPRGQK